MLIDGQYWATPPDQSGNPVIPVQVDKYGRILFVQAIPVGGGITWAAPAATAVTAGPTSTTLVAAAATRKAIMIWNPIVNAQMSVDISGGTATLAGGFPLLAGFSLVLTGAECPVGAITFIGTAGQSLAYQQGT
jgi:hypothetical protein